MGRKSRRRSGHPASAPAGRNSAAKPAGRSAAASASADAAEPFDSSLDGLWATLASGDVLNAEVQASAFASTMLMADSSEEDFGVPAQELPAVLIESTIGGQYTPESAAFCRLLMSLGSPALKAEASRALEEHTDDGIYPPDWVTDAGRPVPRRAWRSYSDFGDDEFIVITFSYGDAEHAILVGLDLTMLPSVGVLRVSPAPDRLIKVIRGRDEPSEGPLTASAGDADAARFWAEVLTGYSGRVPGEPPAQMGPGRLEAALLWHVAGTFTLTDAQRDSLRPAVTAWSRWAAGRHGFDDAATARMLEHLDKVFDNFASAYDNPGSIAHRGYVRDLAVTSDVDVAWLAECRARREFAVPRSVDREPGREVLDAADQDHRVVISMSEFGMCDTGPVPRKEWARAVNRVVEELWHDDPPTTWQAAKRLRAKRMSRHDIIHSLAT